MIDYFKPKNRNTLFEFSVYLVYGIKSNTDRPVMAVRVNIREITTLGPDTPQRETHSSRGVPTYNTAI